MKILIDLTALGILDGPEDPEFQELVELARKIIKVPVSLFSVIDEENDRQFFKSSAGLPDPWATLRETPLSHSICKFVKEDQRPVIISDTRTAPRLAGNKAATELNAIAYMGVPIKDAAEQVIGALCIINPEPRAWTDDELRDLLVLGEAVTSQVRIRSAIHQFKVDKEAAEKVARQLIEKDRIFEDLATNLPGAIFQYKVHPDGRDEVNYMSAGCESIWEISSDEIKDDAFILWSVVDPSDLPDMQSSVMNSAARMSRWEHRWRITTPSGKRKWLHGFGTPRREADGSVLWNSMILDVTVEVTAQNKLNQNMSRLNNMQKQESVGRIAGGIAHDFNNLMAIVLGNAEMLLEGGTEDEMEVYLQEIRKAALRGGELTKRLLSFARKSELVPEALDVNKTVIEMSDLLRRTIPSNIEIKTTLMAGLLQSMVDRSFLESALLNLVLNARDAMPEGGSLTIETANVRIDEEYLEERQEDLEPGRYVMLAVTDTGVGIDGALLESVFEPFVTTKGPDKGTGLGLSMVQGFAKQSGGTVRIYSEPGVGTSIKIYLKARDTRENLSADLPVGEVSGAKLSGRILFAEDENSLRRIVRIFLENAGLEVSDAASGDQAFEIFLRDPDAFDLLVTDIIMPGTLQGPMLAQKIREIRQDMPVVFVSGYPHEANVHGNGIRDRDVSLTKPLERTTFISSIQRALNRTST